MARLRKMIKSFLFEENARLGMTLDEGVRLNPKAHRLELMPVGGPLGLTYPTTLDLYAKTRPFAPESLKTWSGFFVFLQNKKSFSNEQITNVLFRLNDGAQDLYWNTGANAWTIASPNNWNTEAEVSENISAFTGRSLQVVINMSTQDKELTPTVDEIRLSYESDLNFLEDYVVRSFVQDLRDNLRPIGRVDQISDGSTVTIDLTEIQTPYDIVDLDAVYDTTADPNHLSPLDASFNSTTKVITLAAPVSSGSRLSAQFTWRPEVVISKSQDYTEIGKIPVVVLSDTTMVNARPIRARPYILDKVSAQGFMFEDGYQSDINIPFTAITDKAFDNHALAGELQRYFANNKQLRSRGQDELFELVFEVRFDDSSSPSQKELYSSDLVAIIKRAVFYPEDAKSITGVKRFTTSGGNLSFEHAAD